MKYYTPNDLDVDGKRVLVRVDFNVPLREDEQGNRLVTDDTRIRAAIPTIRSIIERNGKAILISHLGRPKGIPDQAFSLSPIAQKLEDLPWQACTFCNPPHK